MNIRRREFFARIGAGLGVPLLASDVCFQDESGTKLHVQRGLKTVWFVDVGRVNLEDLTREAPAVNAALGVTAGETA